MTEDELQKLENRLWEEEGIEVRHILTEGGCKVSVNGQGHLPCNFHKGERAVTYDPKNDPDDYEVDPSEAGEPNEGPQDSDVPAVTADEVEAEENA